MDADVPDGGFWLPGGWLTLAVGILILLAKLWGG